MNIMKLCVGILLLSLLIWLPQSPATATASRPSAGTLITVDTTDDELTINGTCSLREAIQAANTDQAVDGCPAGSAGIDTIVLGAGPYSISRTGIDENSNQTGDFDLAAPMIIQGGASELTVITSSVPDRIFHIMPGTKNVTLTNLRIANGGPVTNGGGIWVESAASASLDHIEMEHNTAVLGGAIFNDGTLHVDHTRFYSNSAANGGALYNKAVLNIQQTQFVSNSASKGINLTTGGAVDNHNGTVQASTLEITDNEAVFGSGIYNSGLFELNDSNISLNVGNFSTEVQTYGGGIYNNSGSSMIVKNLNVDSNTAEYGGGIWNKGFLVLNESVVQRNSTKGQVCTFGGGIANIGLLNIQRSLIRDNSAFMGGGIANLDTLVLNQSSLIANHAIMNDTTCLSSSGGGLMVGGAGTAQIENSTFAENSAATSGGALATFSADGQHSISITATTIYSNTATGGNGAIDTDASHPVTLTQSIVSNNFSAAGTLPDCTENVFSGGFNVLDGCSLTPDASDVITSDAGVGPQQTMPYGVYYTLLPGSPAVDLVPEGAAVCPAVDQRHYPRPVDGDDDMVARCDAGAIEMKSAPVIRTIFVPLLLK